MSRHIVLYKIALSVFNCKCLDFEIPNAFLVARVDKYGTFAKNTNITIREESYPEVFFRFSGIEVYLTLDRILNTNRVSPRLSETLLHEFWNRLQILPNSCSAS